MFHFLRSVRRQCPSLFLLFSTVSSYYSKCRLFFVHHLLQFLEGIKAFCSFPRPNAHNTHVNIIHSCAVFVQIMIFFFFFQGRNIILQLWKGLSFTVTSAGDQGHPEVAYTGQFRSCPVSRLWSEWKTQRISTFFSEIYTFLSCYSEGTLRTAFNHWKEINGMFTYGHEYNYRNVKGCRCTSNICH